MLQPTTLDFKTLRRVEEIGTTDLVIGFPVCNSQDTIEKVISAVSHSVTELPFDLKVAAVLSDCGSSDETLEIIGDLPFPRRVERVITKRSEFDNGLRSLKTIIDISMKLRAEALFIIDPNNKTITPEWAESLFSGVYTEKFDLVLPAYDYFENLDEINQHFAYPLLNALFGLSIRYPLGRDFAISQRLIKFLQSCDFWNKEKEACIAEVMVILYSALGGFKISQINLGAKEAVRPDEKHLDTIFLDTARFIFEFIKKDPSRLNFKAHIKSPPETEVLEAVTESSKNKFYLRKLEAAESLLEKNLSDFLTEENLKDAKKFIGANPKKIRFPAALWCRIIFDFAASYIKNNEDITLLLPFFYARSLSFLREISGINVYERENLLKIQADIFLESKNYLLQRIRGGS